MAPGIGVWRRGMEFGAGAWSLAPGVGVWRRGMEFGAGRWEFGAGEWSLAPGIQKKVSFFILSFCACLKEIKNLGPELTVVESWQLCLALNCSDC